MPSNNVLQCSKTLAAKKLKIAFAESATAGRLASEFALTPKSGDILLGGIVCYDACVKEKLFDIAAATIKKYTPESAEVTKAITEGLLRYFDANVAVGVTGLTTPGGSETAEKPVGTMFIHIIANNKHFAYKEFFSGSPEEIIVKTVDKIAIFISEII